MAAKPVTLAGFSTIVDSLAVATDSVKAVAVGFSGGPDSTALAYLLAVWAAPRGIAVHALSVDHGLRKGSAAEAKASGRVLKPYGVVHQILRWAGRKPKTRIMEEARKARYRLMTDYCVRHGIRHLFLAHHMDDQAETFLIRLAAGSGLDGLAGMKPVSHYHDILLLRPFLDTAKEDLVATCRAHKLAFVKDPSNSRDRFARPRLRKARAVLEEEGLTSKRLAVTAMRLARAQKSLDQLAEKEYKNSIINKNSKRTVFKLSEFNGLVEEVRFRVLVRAIRDLRPGADYMPRMEKIEALFSDLISPGVFRKRTLGGLIFERDDRKDTLSIFVEKPLKLR